MQQENETGNRAHELALQMQEGCLGLRVSRLNRLVSRRFDQLLRPLRLSLQQLEVLSALTLWAEPVRPGDVAQLLSIERSTMSRNLALLETRRLVATTLTSATGRSMAVTITPEGTRTLADAGAAWAQAQESVLALLGADAPGLMSGWIESLDRSSSAVTSDLRRTGTVGGRTISA